MSAFAVFKDAWLNRESIGEANKSKELAAFLPAALEIQEVPPNPLLRWLSKTLLLLISIAVAWAYFGHINIVASAQGKIIPSARIKQIQPLEKGLVKTLYVAEGDLVEKDQPLIALDSTLNRADTKRLASELHSTQLRLAVNQAFLNTVSDSAPVSASSEKNQNEDKTLPSTPSKAITSSAIQAQLLNTLAQLQWELEPKKADVQLHQRLLLQKWLEYRAQLQSLRSGLQQNLAEQMATQAVIKKLKLTKPIVNQRTRVLKKLLKEKLVAETEYLQVAQERIQIQQDFAAEQQRLKQLQAVVIDLKQQINLHNAQTSSLILTEITDQQRQIAGLTEELIKTRDNSAKQIIYAPVAGRVQELAVHTIGGVPLCQASCHPLK